MFFNMVFIRDAVLGKYACLSCVVVCVVVQEPAIHSFVPPRCGDTGEHADASHHTEV